MTKKSNFKKISGTTWYTLEVLEGGKWVVPDRAFCDDECRRDVRREFCEINFFGQKVRMLENVRMSRVLGVKDFRHHATKTP